MGWDGKPEGGMGWDEEGGIVGSGGIVYDYWEEGRVCDGVWGGVSVKERSREVEKGRVGRVVLVGYEGEVG